VRQFQLCTVDDELQKVFPSLLYSLAILFFFLIPSLDDVLIEALLLLT
jgi:hypothetical protein